MKYDRFLRSTALVFAASFGTSLPLLAQTQPRAVVNAVPTSDYSIGNLRASLRSDTQTLARLSPVAEPFFSFVPSAREAERSGDGYNHVGDLNLRVRTLGGDWRDFASSHARRSIVPLAARGAIISAADITASMGDGAPFRVERRWMNGGNTLALHFVITNTSGGPLEIGVLGMPMVFDNIITGRDLNQAHTQASFVDPYIGRDAGYLQVTRLNGHGPALLVLPEPGTPLESYAPLKNQWEDQNSIFTDKSPREQTAEGFYDWTVYSAGYANREWKNAGEQWNVPTSRVLKAGESLDVGVRFVPSPNIRAIQSTLTASGRPVAVGVPGYVVPTDQSAALFLKSPSTLSSIESSPAGSVDATIQGDVNGWTRVAIRGRRFGQARLTLTYANGEKQTVSYFVTKPLDQTVADLGRFSTTKQWFEGKGDPFGRSPAIMTYDKEAQKIVSSEPRVWIAGVSDEGGAGSWVAATMKQLDNPNPVEIAKIERMVDKTVVGNLQVASGDHIGGVKRSLFYYDPGRFSSFYPGDPSVWSGWSSWNNEYANDLSRAYNYPHVAVGHWVLYRTARNHQGMIKLHDWKWYLDHAYLTVVAMMREGPDFAQFGLMEADVFVDILKDLKREGMMAEAANMENLMAGRAAHWRSLAYPFGSEMPWDSTGQPEVYAWMRYFGYQPQADITRDVILGYDPTMPSWGYNGNARRYWDFSTAGKYQRIERQIHHYGSTLNAVPLFDAYRQNPSDLYLLRVAYGGFMGGVTNIDQDGASSAAFHAWPDMMKWDPYSGDYGTGFFGHAYAAASYLVKDPTFGWLGFGGNITEGSGEVRIEPKDGARSRLFVAPAGAWITLQAGKIASASYVPGTGKISLILDAASASTPAARIFVEATTKAAKSLAIVGAKEERGGFTVPLGPAATTVTLQAR